VIALLCATLLCLATADPRWQFTVYQYGRPILMAGWRSEQECREQKGRMARDYPGALVTDCEISR
jgi:hypothetical protein